MSEDIAKAPRHLWVVGILSLLWNLTGAAVYTLTMMRDPQALDGADPQMVAAIDASPVWATGAWALGVWAALAGSILLLARRRLAVTAFGVSLLGLAVVGGYEYVVRMPTNLAQNLAIWLIALLVWLYARAMAERGVLR